MSHEDMLRVALFAGMADAAGTRQAEIRWRGGSVADLRAALEAAYPAIGGLLARSAVAIGNRYAADEAEVPATADVAIIPPVSGG
ncbi:MAG: MoaD/ThiS family protein [Planctomycetaceae bacterium]|nr:MoaD/ThiS family protein [Planctomycetaceae bacterium]